MEQLINNRIQKCNFIKSFTEKLLKIWLPSPWTPLLQPPTTLDPTEIVFSLMFPILKSSILTGKLQWDTHICGNPTPLSFPPPFHLSIHLWHRGLLCTTYYFPSACLPTIFLKQFALTTALAFAALNHSVIYFYTSYLKNCNSLLMSVSFNFQFICSTCNFFF